MYWWQIAGWCPPRCRRNLDLDIHVEVNLIEVVVADPVVVAYVLDVDIAIHDKIVLANLVHRQKCSKIQSHDSHERGPWQPFLMSSSFWKPFFGQCSTTMPRQKRKPPALRQTKMSMAISTHLQWILELHDFDVATTWHCLPNDVLATFCTFAGHKKKIVPPQSPTLPSKTKMLFLLSSLVVSPSLTHIFTEKNCLFESLCLWMDCAAGHTQICVYLYVHNNVLKDWHLGQNETLSNKPQVGQSQSMFDKHPQNLKTILCANHVFRPQRFITKQNVSFREKPRQPLEIMKQNVRMGMTNTWSI